MSNYILIGHVVNIFGIKGELKITSQSDFIDYRYAVGKTIYFKKASSYIEAKVSSFRLIKNNPTIRINDSTDPNYASTFIGCDVYALGTDKPELEKGTYYIDDLIDLDVICNNLVIGKVKDVIKIPTNSILEVSLLDNTTKLIPLIPDYVIEVNKENIIVKEMEVI